MNKGIKLRVGGRYRDRDGNPVEIIEKNAPQKHSPYRFRAHNHTSYTPDGRAFDDRSSVLDIVEEIGSDPEGSLRAKILSSFEDPAKWPMADAERVALLRELYAMAKGGAR